MRIVIDMQGAQASSRFRGIGRYTMSFTQAIVRNCGNHEIILALNGLFYDTIEPIRAAFNNMLPQENIRVWYAVKPVAFMDFNNDWRRKSAELVREAFLASLRPDVVHVSSLFEGISDDTVSSVGLLSRNILVSVTLYDLIPLIYSKIYLKNPIIDAWYRSKLEHLRCADLLLAISESSRREGIDYLDFPEDRSINISTDADKHFQPQQIFSAIENALRHKYGLTRPFVMYTGGIDHRKNIEALIRAFSILPIELRKSHQLAIVCSVQPESRLILEKHARQQGLGEDEIVFTGFVPEDDLVALYNLCKLFVFPSWHEGFGLPALEAMRCGAPVIGANTSSLPEVIGWEKALFNPHSDEDIAQAIKHALSDERFRLELIHHGKLQAEKFSWDESARKAISSMERLHVERQARIVDQDNNNTHRLKLAYISPLPPERSGISYYSAELLPELVRWYDIDVIVVQDEISDTWITSNCPVRSVQWFIENASRYDRVLYHFGNSAFHQHMFDLLKLVPGVVVLHDFFLSGIIHYLDAKAIVPDFLNESLYESHGYPAIHERAFQKDAGLVLSKYPCNLGVLQDSLGIIVHSVTSYKLAEKWYGRIDQKDLKVIPLLRNPPQTTDRSSAKAILGFQKNDFIVCSFGFMAPSKLNHRLLSAWLESTINHDQTCHLIFVGEKPSGEYGSKIMSILSNAQPDNRISITGWVDMDTFQQYLLAADVGVQLRSLSRGETSASALDCLNYGLATIVNANGSMAELPDEAVWMLPDEFSDEQLAEALETLWKDKSLRQKMGDNGRSIILQHHSPILCAESYKHAIEEFYGASFYSAGALVSAIAPNVLTVKDNELARVAENIAESILLKIGLRQLFIDVSVLVRRTKKSGIQRLVNRLLNPLLLHQPEGWRIEPVYASQSQGYRYARRFTLQYLDCNSDNLIDEPIEYKPGDIFLGFDLNLKIASFHQSFFQRIRNDGVNVRFIYYDKSTDLFHSKEVNKYTKWLDVVLESIGVICNS